MNQRRTAIYARVSTSHQTVENQIRELRAFAAKREYTIVAEFIDQGISGAKGRDNRPGLAQLCAGAFRNEFDVVLVWSIDRLGRSTTHLVELLNEFHERDIDLVFIQQQIDTTTAAGKLCFSVFGALAEFERQLIQERVRAGQERARANGVKLGRPSRMNDSLKSAARLLREKGVGIKEIATKLEIGVGTVYKALAEAA